MLPVGTRVQSFEIKGVDFGVDVWVPLGRAYRNYASRTRGVAESRIGTLMLHGKHKKVCFSPSARMRFLVSATPLQREADFRHVENSINSNGFLMVLSKTGIKPMEILMFFKFNALQTMGRIALWGSVGG